MIERVIILAVLVVLGMVAWQVLNRQRVRKATTAVLSCPTDPYLMNFRAGVPGVVLFTADYCYPCKSQQQPAIRNLVDQLGTDKVQCFQVDVEANPDVAQRWGVLSLPTTFILDGNGTPREVNHGVTPAQKLKRQIEAL